MDDETFARQLSAWVDPSAVLRAVRGHAGTDARVQQPGFIAVPGAAPGGARAIGLDILVRKFLQGFRLPVEYVAMLAAGFPGIPQPSWDYALGLRFEGEVLSGPETGDANTILLVTDRDSVADIVAIPVGFLARRILSIANDWINR